MLARFVVVALAWFAAATCAQDLSLRPRLTIATPVEEPVHLRAVRIDAEVAGSLARTSVELAFHNPNARVLEGELAFPLADGQAIVGLAMDVDGRLREGVPVEKARGRMVFEDVTRQRIDPALVEATGGNQYRLRVYPILARSDKRVVIRTGETLDARRGQRVLRIPIDYGTIPVSLAISVQAGGGRPRIVGIPQAFVRDDDGRWQAEMRPEHIAGRRHVDIVVPAPQGPEVVTGMHEGQRYFHVELPWQAAAGKRTMPRRVALVWDSSGSGAARDHASELALLDRYFGAMRDGEVVLVRLRDSIEHAGTFAIRAGDWAGLRAVLESTAYDGATNSGAFPAVPGVDEYVLVSDGVATFGDAPFAPPAVRLHAIVSTAGADAARLRNLAHATGGRFVDLTRVPVANAARMLVRDGVRILDVSGAGVSDIVSASPFAERGRFVVAGAWDGKPAALTLRIGRNAASARTVRVAIEVTGPDSALVPTAWAGLRVAALESDPIANRGAIIDLGKRFCIVTRQTSLIVLDRVEDYVRHDIVPPPELLAEFDRLRAMHVARKDRDANTQIERVVAMLREKEAWWHRSFPKDAPPLAIASPERQSGALRQERRAQRGDLPASAPAPAAPASQPPADRAAGRAVAKSGNRQGNDADAIVVRLKRWTPDAPYIAKLRQAKTGTLYDAYLSERAQYATSTAFFLDAADELFERGQRDLAIRVLSNLAELDLGNRQVLRILGYRLMQAGEAPLALPVLRRVLELAPDEPQSWRDLGLAYAADGQCQRAVDALHEVVRRPWHGRFPGVELIALGELNATLATCASAVSTAGIDPRLLKNLPVDLRVVLTWDADNTDIDLWVTDPDGERAYYGHPLTRQGGRMSPDFTGGYGPEEFSLKRAKPGRYRVEAHFYGHRQQIVAGATTLQVGFQTRFGTPAMSERAVTLRLAGQGRQVFVGEFDVDLPH